MLIDAMFYLQYVRFKEYKKNTRDSKAFFRL